MLKRPLVNILGIQVFNWFLPGAFLLEAAEFRLNGANDRLRDLVLNFENVIQDAIVFSVQIWLPVSPSISRAIMRIRLPAFRTLP